MSTARGLIGPDQTRDHQEHVWRKPAWLVVSGTSIRWSAMQLWWISVSPQLGAARRTRKRLGGSLFARATLALCPCAQDGPLWTTSEPSSCTFNYSKTWHSSATAGNQSSHMDAIGRTGVIEGHEYKIIGPHKMVPYGTASQRASRKLHFSAPVLCRFYWARCGTDRAEYGVG
jgi:hypothetical protein